MAKMTSQGRHERIQTDWVSAREASAMLGVSPATLRRWSDHGQVRAFTTPGGHRRFARESILSVLPPTHRAPDPMQRLGTPERIASALLESLDGKTPEHRDRAIRHAAAAAVEYGRAAGEGGVGMCETVEAFLRFRARFVHDLTCAARFTGLDAGTAAGLLQAATDAVDRLLIATVRGHDTATHARRRRQPLPEPFRHPHPGRRPLTRVSPGHS